MFSILFIYEYVLCWCLNLKNLFIYNRTFGNSVLINLNIVFQNCVVKEMKRKNWKLLCQNISKYLTFFWQSIKMWLLGIYFNRLDYSLYVFLFTKKAELKEYFFKFVFIDFSWEFYKKNQFSCLDNSNKRHFLKMYSSF